LNPTRSARPRLAAIDVGSNTIRLVVAEVENDGTYRVLDEEREMARLGRGLSKTGRLADESMQLALETIGKMKAIADGFGAEVRAIATSAVRDAANGLDFCKEVERLKKVRLEVIGGEEEGLLAFRSAAHNFKLDGRPVVVADIGGGSMEVVLAAGTVIENVHSLPLGTVRLTEEYCRTDPLRAKHWKALKEEIDAAIKRKLGASTFRADTLVGSGGTFNALAEMVRWGREGQSGSVQGYALSRAELTALLRRLLKMPVAMRRQIPGLNPKRADIILAGAAAVARLAKRLGCQKILVNERGIRDGLLRTMIAEKRGRSPAFDPEERQRIEWVRILARKCRSNERHCEHVARLAGEIFDGLRRALKLPPYGRELVQAAALLHDIGYLVCHSQHHKHAYHLIINSGIAGYSSRELELIGNIARYHRRAPPKKSHENFARLRPRDRKLVRILSGILRVADGLDRTHTQRVRSVRVRVSEGFMRLLLQARSSPQVEVWDAYRKSSLLEKTIGRHLEVVWGGAGAKRRRLLRQAVVAAV
jgi:exopolyphosphatase/guanosine-5'-triphosphate,3'-diphosphate pyrophosphatase